MRRFFEISFRDGRPGLIWIGWGIPIVLFIVFELGRWSCN
jgi:hypothetical protein